MDETKTLIQELKKLTILLESIQRQMFTTSETWEYIVKISLMNLILLGIEVVFTLTKF
jgi:hypothetical protein